MWRLMTRQTENIAIVANSEKQAIGTAFKLVRGAFEHTPFLKRLVTNGSIIVGADKIEIPSTSSLARAYTSNPAALWGAKLTCAQISELHAARNGGDDVFEALAGSLLDSVGSLMLIDSTTSSKSSKLWELYQAANHDADPDRSIYFSHLAFRDLDDACNNCPPWITPEKLRSLSRQMLPGRFNALHLNKWSDAANLLFPADILDPAIEAYPLNVLALAAGSAVIVGGGLDRAFGGTVRGDATVCAAVAKLALDDEEHIFILDADAVPFSRAAGIKSRFDGYHRDYGMTRLGLESYGAQDIADWAASRPYSAGTEVFHPSRRLKYSAFLALYQAAAERRLHIHPKFADLIAEMRVFEVHEDGKATDGEAAVPKFQHPRGKHDDFLHAVVWALYSLRSVTLNPYEIHGIACNGRGASIQHCSLNGGGHIPPCADACRSMTDAMRLYGAYLARGPLVPLPLPAFIADKLKNVGSHTLPR